MCLFFSKLSIFISFFKNLLNICFNWFWVILGNLLRKRNFFFPKRFKTCQDKKKPFDNGPCPCLLFEKTECKNVCIHFVEGFPVAQLKISSAIINEIWSVLWVPGLWLAERDQVTWTLASHWFRGGGFRVLWGWIKLLRKYLRQHLCVIIWGKLIHSFEQITNETYREPSNYNVSLSVYFENMLVWYCEIYFDPVATQAPRYPGLMNDGQQEQTEKQKRQ